MEWSPQQDRALKAVAAWLSDPHAYQVFRLFGYAGTGKTTLAQHLAKDVAGRVLFGAYTGKAAHVLQQKGCPAQTIHSMIYVPRGKSAERLHKLEQQLLRLDPEDPEHAQLVRAIHEERDNLKKPAFQLNVDSPVRAADLVVIDECSMVDERMGEDLLHFGCKVLVLGDPAQLPPVRGGGYFTNHDPDILLTEIHRQASDNPIIKLATAVRCGENLTLGEYGESRIVSELDPDDALGADQIIVGMNRTRRAANTRIRQLRGYAGVTPEVGERLVCLRNNHELGLLNGSIWYTEQVYSADDPVVMTIRPEDETWTQEVLAHRAHFAGEEMDHWTRLEAEEFDYGYALTCHKAQGSQWDNVMIIDESGVFKQNARRWLYTALTRAAERVTIKL
jgi:exodeoxyribonuclease V